MRFDDREDKRAIHCVALLTQPVNLVRA